MTATDPRPPAEAAALLAAAVEELIALAHAAGHHDLASRLADAAARWPEATATVVVVGEAGAGRSTVVNALVGRLDPPLLPLGGSFAVVRYGPSEEVRAHAPGEEEPPKIGTISVPPPIGPGDVVEIVVPAIAAGNHLVLVDAPAAGPAGDPRRRVIDELVGSADGVVLATRADAPLTAPEVALLRAARRRVGGALVVTTRVDRHRGWREVIDESRATLRSADVGHGLIENLPLAAPIAAEAIAEAQAGGEEAESLARESGLDQLQLAVRTRFADDVERLRCHTLAELSRDVIDELIEVAALAAATTDADAQDLRRRAEARREDHEAMLVRLGDEFTLLRDSLPLEVGRAAADVTREVNATLPDDEDAVLVPDLAAHLLEAARLRLETSIDRRVEALVRDVLTGDAAGDGGGPIEDPPTRPHPGGDRRRRASASMRLRLVQALLSSGGGVAMLAVVGGTGATAAEALRVGALGVGMLVGGVRAVEGVRESKRQRTTQAAKAALRGAVDRWRDEFLVATRERLLREQRAQEAALREAIRGEVAELERRASSVEEAGRAGTAEEALDTGALRALRSRLDEIVGLLSA